MLVNDERLNKIEYATRVIHPTKLKILQSIKDGKNTFTELMTIVSKAVLAAHLRFLLEHGFIAKEGENKKVKYKITEKGEALLRFVDWFSKEYEKQVENKKE